MLLAAVATLPWADRARADDAPLATSLETSVGLHYSTGHYGTSSATDILYAPLLVRGLVDAWTFEVTLPWIWIRSGGGIVQGPNGPIDAASGEEQGLGDVLGRASYTLAPVRTWLPWTELAGLVKFPTASRAKGLGTGEFDFGVETDLTWVVDRLTPFAAVGYRFLGSSASIPLHDVVTASGGAQYRLVDGVNAGMLVDWRQAASAASGARLELVPFASWRVQAHWVLQAYATAGLADGSPEAGTGVTVGWTF